MLNFSVALFRSFCAQLLANAQAAAAAENNKVPNSSFLSSFSFLEIEGISDFEYCVCLNLQKQVCVNVDAGKKAGGAPKPPQKKATVKPKPVEVIDVSPDTQEDDAKPKQENNPIIKKKDGEARSGKKAHAFSSVLTARSKVKFQFLFLFCCLIILQIWGTKNLILFC